VKNHRIAGLNLQPGGQGVERNRARPGDALAGVLVRIANINQRRAFGDQRAGLLGQNKR